MNINVDSIRVLGTDLDDTLHYFRKASGAAANSVLNKISEITGHDQVTLNAKFEEILSQDQSGHFTENKPSAEYRRHRFERLIESFSISSSVNANDLVALYDDALGKNLELKKGAVELLQSAKQSGNKVVVITEGPHDAQEKTLSKLGILSYIDIILSSSQNEKSKSNGLFDLALQKLNILSDEILYVGDNPSRDYYPAINIGIKSIILDDNNKYLDNPDRIDSLIDLVPLFQG